MKGNSSMDKNQRPKRIRHLHEKVDHPLSHQWERLAQIQEIQLELLAELGKRR